MRSLRSQELDFEHENKLGIHTEALHVDFARNVRFLSIRKLVLTMKTLSGHVLQVYQLIFQKVVIFSPDLVIVNFRVLRYQELNYEQKKSSGLIIEGLHVDCAKNTNSIL